MTVAADPVTETRESIEAFTPVIVFGSNGESRLAEPAGKPGAGRPRDLLRRWRRRPGEPAV